MTEMILITPDDLTARIQAAINGAFIQFMEALIIPTPIEASNEVLVSQVELGRLLNVSVQTIIAQREKGNIPYHRIGGKPLYMLSEVKKALKVKTKKLRRA
jgi:hypothetical protein